MVATEAIQGVIQPSDDVGQVVSDDLPQIGLVKHQTALAVESQEGLEAGEDW